MDVLIFGGTRYIGRSAVEQLLSAGHNVTVFSRGNNSPPFINDIEQLVGDKNDNDGLTSILKNRVFDGVIDNLCYDRNQAASVINALRGNVGRYIATSTVSTYGGLGHYPQRLVPTPSQPNAVPRFAHDDIIEPVSEQMRDPLNDSWVYRRNLSPYGEGKRHMERVMCESPDDWPWVVVRAPVVLGEHDHTGRFAWWLARIMDGGPILMPDGGQHQVQFGYVRDLSRFLVNALSTPQIERNFYNYAQRETVRFAEFLNRVASAIGTTLATVDVPFNVLGQQGNLPWHDYSFAPFIGPDIVMMSESKSLQEIGMNQTPLNEWIKSTVDWFTGNPDVIRKGKKFETRSFEISFARTWSKTLNSLNSPLI